MTSSARSSWLSKFSHIYIEESARKFPRTEEILQRLRHAVVVSLDDYKEIFSRPRQHHRTQKRSLKLILARKKDNFLYPGSPQSQDFGFRNFYYNTLILNCQYSCDYCYLQGMYPSANIVIFVNLEEFFIATEQALANRTYQEEPLYLCLSYDTDLLAFEPLVPYGVEWIQFAEKQPDLVVEIRTKSALYKAIRHLPPTERVILAWTLSPASVAKHHEKDAPSLTKRLQAIELAVNDGWPVRLCFDPVLAIDGWEEIYAECIAETFDRLSAERIRDVAVGVFRMNRSYFRRIERQRGDTELFAHPYESKDNLVSYPKAQRKQMVEFMTEKLLAYLPEEKIDVWV